MSKLLQRLCDPKRSAVYRANDARAIVDVTAGSGLDVVAIDASERPLEKLAIALDFPKWFGGNWDALADSLGDLSWRKGEGHVLVFTGYPENHDVLIDVLHASAEYWAGRGKPFFAVFIDPARKLALPELYREA
jgi:Barstar (barnase inhibitor)